MAGSQVSLVDAVMIEKQRLGYAAISLTNFASATLEPQIAAGSKVEIGGSLFEFTAPESITGWAGIAISNQAYIKLTVAGAAVSASWTTTAPTWSTSKQGWYDGLTRYVGGCYKDSGGNYTKKWLYREHSGGVQTIKELGDGTLYLQLLPNTLSEGSQVIASLSTWTLPAGSYLLNLVPAGTNRGRVEFLSGGSWRPLIDTYSGQDRGGAVFSDGTNVRVNNYSGLDTVTVYWLRLDEWKGS